MKRLLPLLVSLLLTSPALASAVLYVSQNGGGYFTTSTCGPSTAITPTAGNDLIVIAETFTTSASFSSISNSISATITTDSAFAVSSPNNIGYGIWRVHGASASSQTFTVTFGAAVNCYLWVLQASSVGSFDQVSSVISGSTTAFAVPSTASFVPTVSGALVLAVGGTGTSKTWGTWNYTALSARSAGPSAVAAYLDQSVAAGTNATATISASAAWSGVIFDYVPAVPPFIAAPVYSGGKPLMSKGSFVN